MYIKRWDVLFEHVYYCVVAEEEPTSGASNTGEGKQLRGQD